MPEPEDAGAVDGACDCDDPEACYTHQLIADRDAGWKEAETQKARAERLDAAIERLAFHDGANRRRLVDVDRLRAALAGDAPGRGEEG